VLVGGVVVIAAAAWQGVDGLGVALLIAGVLVLAARVVGPTDGFLRDSATGVFAIAYVAGGAAFGVMLALDPDQGADRLVAVLATAVAVDIGGYLAGVSFGRHPMAPRVSPKKTWEGLAGSVIAACAVAAGTFVWLLDAPWWQGVVFGLLLCPVAVIGDLAESAMKRDAGVKDSGTLLPGHGGMLDRLDSLLLSAPVGWLLLTWLLA
jgi:phosphatidate cytidylyltransferase